MIIFPIQRITTGVKALISLLTVLAINNFGLVLQISLKNLGMVRQALKESLILVLSFSVIDFKIGLGNLNFIFLRRYLK